MRKFLNFLLVAIISLTLFACDYVSGTDSESDKVDRKEYSVSIVYRESALGVEKTESADFSLEVGQEKDVEIPVVEDDGTDNALICWVVNGVEAENSVGISSIKVKRTENGATVTVGSTTVDLGKDETLISLSTKYPIVDVYDFSFAYKTNADAELSTQTSTIQLAVGQMNTINLPTIDVENNDTFEGWVVNGQLAENSVSATTVVVSRSESGIQLVIGGSTFNFDTSVFRFELSTKYGQAIVIPPVDQVSYKITIKYQVSENSAYQTDERTVTLDVGEQRTINLPTIKESELEYWKVNGEKAKSSKTATSFTIKRTETGVEVTLGDSTFVFDNNTAIKIETLLFAMWTDNY
ncbi:MAG: hypothetical protein IJW64_02455 [Clostridia bacterium]|nr:hypothetical protein [Clostridia bacterium]